MQQYRTALHHLGLARDAMVDRGDVPMITAIAPLIRRCDIAILDHQRGIIEARLASEVQALAPPR